MLPGKLTLQWGRFGFSNRYKIERRLLLILFRKFYFPKSVEDSGNTTIRNADGRHRTGAPLPVER